MHGHCPHTSSARANPQEGIAGGADREEQLRIGVTAYRLGSPRVVGIGSVRLDARTGHDRLHRGDCENFHAQASHSDGLSSTTVCTVLSNLGNNSTRLTRGRAMFSDIVHRDGDICGRGTCPSAAPPSRTSTIAAFRLAAALGSDAVELDVRRGRRNPRRAPRSDRRWIVQLAQTLATCLHMCQISHASRAASRFGTCGGRSQAFAPTIVRDPSTVGSWCTTRIPSAVRRTSSSTASLPNAAARRNAAIVFSRSARRRRAARPLHSDIPHLYELCRRTWPYPLSTDELFPRFDSTVHTVVESPSTCGSPARENSHNSPLWSRS